MVDYASLARSQAKHVRYSAMAVDEPPGWKKVDGVMRVVVRVVTVALLANKLAAL